MSKVITTKTNDTFDSISRREYGVESESNTIAAANPGVSEPLSVGLNIIIPELPSNPKDKTQQTPAANVSELSILIDDTQFKFWTEFRITRSIDSLDTVEFLTPSNTESKKFRETFKPFTYKPVSVYVGGAILFKGVLVGVQPNLEPDSKTVLLSCYSIPGVLNDCSPSSSTNQKLEFNNLSLKEIATELCQPFGIGVLFHVDQGSTFERLAIKPNDKILSFLSGLAKQRNIIISNTENGELLFTKSVNVGQPIAKLEQGKPPLLSVSVAFNAQGYFSHLTGIVPTALGFSGPKYTVKNDRLQGVIRPISFSVPYTPDADIKTATESMAGRMFGNMVSYSVKVPTWFDSKNTLWKPNTTVILLAPDAMIYTNYEFVIRGVTLQRDNNGEIAELNLVLPGSFEGKIAEYLPWDE